MERDKSTDRFQLRSRAQGDITTGMISFLPWTCTYTVRTTYSRSTIQTKTRRLDVLVSPLPLHSLSYFPLYLSQSPPLLLHVIASERAPSEFQLPRTRQPQNGRPTRRRAAHIDSVTVTVATGARVPAAIPTRKWQQCRSRKRCDA